MKIRTLTNILFYIFVLSFSVFLVASTITNAIFDMEFYKEQFTELEVSADNPVEKTLLVLYYFKNGERYIDQSSMVFLDKDFTEREKEHLRDVKEIISAVSKAFDYSFITMMVSLFLGLSLIVLYGEENKRGYYIRKFLLRGLGYSVIFILVAGGVLALSSHLFYDTVFVKFHELLFASGTWTFPKDSLLIQLYPYEFFQSFFWKIIKEIFLNMLVVAGLWMLLLLEFVHYLDTIIKKKKQKSRSKNLSRKE